MTDDAIRFNKPSLEGNEVAYIQSAVEAGHTSCSGPHSAAVSTLLCDWLGSADALLTTSCTAALEMSAMLLDLGPEDTVVVPSFTFVSTALAFARQGAKIIFCDIEPETLGLDPDHVLSVLSPSVKAVVPVHYAGIGCRISELCDVTSERDIAIVEDNAHGLFGTYRGRPLGSIGRFASLSFHETKNFTCGEGGALILNDESDIERAHVLYDKGTNRRAFLLGDVDKYSWQDIGSSFGMSEVLAAFLHGQLEKADIILAKRQAVYERYVALLEPIAGEHGLRLPVVPPDREQAYHMFYVLLPEKALRDHALASMKSAGIHPTFHYVPLHDAPAAAKYAAYPTDCPVSTDIAGRLLRLPFHNNLSESDAQRVVVALQEALESFAGTR